MAHDKNKTNITKHIKRVADGKPVFSMGDLINTYFGVHHSDDWQERLDSLVARGWLYAKEVPGSSCYGFDYSLEPL